MPALKLISVCVFSVLLTAKPSNLIGNGKFLKGTTGWELPECNVKCSVSISEVAGAKTLVMQRLQAGVPVGISWPNIKFKPQTLYKLTLVGFGKNGAVVALRPASSKDPEYFALAKSWATSTAPVAKSEKPTTTVFHFDSGLKADNALLTIRLQDGGPMTYTVKSVRLEPVQSTAESVKELVIAHIGDSFTSTTYLPFEERLDSLLQKLFAANAPKLKVRNVNLGADGEYLQEMIDTGRYEKAIHQQYARIDVAVIRYGGNDSRKYSPAEFAKWLGVLSDKISKDYPGVKIMIGTGIWLKGDDDVNKRQYGAYWQASRDFAAARKFPLADIAAAFEEANSDGLTIGKGDMHPSAEGVRLVALTEFKVLKALLGK